MDEKLIEELLLRDAARTRRMLSAVIGATGLTRQDVDRRLGRRHGSVSNILTGRVDLKQEHVAAILLVCGIHPGTFYQALYPQARPFGPLKATADFPELLALAGLTVDELEQMPEPEPAPVATKQELDQLIEEAIGRALAAHEEAQRKRRATKRRRPAAERTGS